MPVLNVSIVTYHTPEDELRLCLSSLLACRVVARVDVVDNGSESRIKDICNEFADKRINYIANPNTGYGSGHNLSLRRTLEEGLADCHLVVNTDVDFKPEDLEQCVRYMAENPDVGQLIPRVIYPDGAFQGVAHRLPNPVDVLLHRFGSRKIMKRWFANYDLSDPEPTEPLNVPFHHGCFMLLRTDALRKVGIFDERYFMYCEDIDLSRRMHRLFKTIYYPYVTIRHTHRASSQKELRMLAIHGMSLFKYFMKWGVLFDSEKRRFNKAFEARRKK